MIGNQGRMSGGWRGDEEARRRHGWTQTGQLAVNTPAKTVSLQAYFPEAGPYTVQFGVNPPVYNDPPFYKNQAIGWQATADIEWCVEGGSVMRQITVSDGTEISAPAEAVRVKVTDSTEVSSISAVLYTVTIDIVRGLRASYGRLPILSAGLPTQLAANGGSETIAMPQGIGVIAVEMAIAPTNGAYTVPACLVEFYQVLGGILADALLSVYLQTVGDQGFVTVPPGTTYVKITNADPANPAYVTVNWGIDG